MQKRIAYITYEYPPDIHAGGIATYVYEVSKMMAEAGWDVEIFAGSFKREGFFVEEGIKVNRIKILGVNDFRNKVAKTFAERNKVTPFDVYETPEINSNAWFIAGEFKDIPFVTKLHTPISLQIKLMNHYIPFLEKMRFVMGALKKGRIDLGFWRKSDPHPELDNDYNITVKANGIISPSVALKIWAEKYWKIPEGKITILANIFSPSQKLLQQDYNTERKYLTFIGKLNVHKGMVALTKALPAILDALPQLVCCFIGNDGNGPGRERSMRRYMQQKLTKYQDRILFTGPLNADEIAQYLSESKACIFPSIWEAFGYVSLEAMSAGVPVIVSKNSGMGEIVGDNEYGVLIDPLSPADISKKTIALLNNKSRLETFSEKGRLRVINEYTRDAWKARHVQYYSDIIKNHKSKPT